MAGYIKSHSNYRLQTRHQIVNDGVILERDISTIGGVNSFATGQSTIYQSGNFVIVVNNSSSASRHIKKRGWLPAGNDSDAWSKETLSQHSSDVNGSVEKSIMLKNDFMDLRSFAYYGSLANLVENTISQIINTFPYEIYVGVEQEPVEMLIDDVLTPLYEVSNPGGIDIYSQNRTTKSDSELGHFYEGGYQNYCIIIDGYAYPISSWSVSETPTTECVEPGEKLGKITISCHPYRPHYYVTLYAFLDYNREIKYYTTDGSIKYSIRPRLEMGFYEDFVDNLDLFGKCLVGVYSGIRNTAKFEVLSEGRKGTKRTVQTFTFPSGPGGYNLGSDSTAMQNYISNLGKIGIRYDEMYTDNMFRMMTHDSLKNLDWTKTFNGNDENDDDNHYVRTGEKFASVIRIMGYTFDNEKAYIDSIGNANTVTYSNRANLSDYFLTDALETDGFIVNTIYPYDLKEYDHEGNENVNDWSFLSQYINNYRRKFSENTADIITPYYYSDGGFYTKCINGKSYMFPVPEYKPGQMYYVEDENVYNIISDYHNDFEMTIPEVNNEFMKRFKINSRYILRKKGTVDGIEALLSLFGLKSKRWCDGEDSKYDFDIIEKTYFTAPLLDTMDNVHMMDRMDWYNSCKTIPYNTQSYINGEYIPYQGLPVAYKENPKYKFSPDVDYTKFVASRSEEENPEWKEVVTDSEDKILFGIRQDGSLYMPDVDGYTMSDGYGNVQTVNAIIGGLINPRKVYPFFQHNGIYDGDMYYQMNGGWIGYLPYMFDVNDDILINNDASARVETMRNISQVMNMNELISQPIGDLYNGAVYYVTNINDRFALINGYPYELKEESVNGETKYYFEVSVFGGAISVGGDLYTGKILVSDQSSSTTTIDLPLYSDGSVVKIYYMEDRDYAFYIESEDDYRPESSLIFINGTYINNSDYASHYFELQDVNNCGKIGVDSWRAISKSSNTYKKLENITDNTLGNNPHSGNFSYDNGREYLRRYEQLFKYASENRYFNESCFPDVDDAYEEINEYGFNITELTDSKVHTFADKLEIINGDAVEVKYDINTNASIEKIDDYKDVANVDGADSVTSQIINVKNFELVFYLRAELNYSKEGQEEIKYIQSKIMPYVEQMLPSTAIVNVRYESAPTPQIKGSFNDDFDISYDV